MIEVIYKDDNIIVADKPPGIVVFHQTAENDRSLSEKLLEDYPEIEGVGGERNGAVHRLDKDTSGVILFARNENALTFLQNEFFNKRVEKKYTTLVFKKVKEDEGEIRTFIDRSRKDRRKQKASMEGKREAVTYFRVIEHFDNFSLLEVFPKTGRKHQIRCHMSYIGHPVAGDNLYRFKDQRDPKGLTRQFLHASSLKIKMLDGEVKEFHSPLAKDLKGLLKQIKEN